MDDIYVLNSNLELIEIIDRYKSCIWANRYKTSGDCELYVEATNENLQLLAKGNYLMRFDDEMVCQIRKIELETDAENGNYLIVSGYDVKKLLFQRIVWGTEIANGNVEDFVRRLVDKNLCTPTLNKRKMLKPNGERLFYLGDKANFTEVMSEQISYANVGVKVEEICNKYNWGYKVTLDDGKLYFQLYKGANRSDFVIFSDEYENLLSTTYIEDATNINNVALVAGEGEGSQRLTNVSGDYESLNRFEIYVDARDLSKNTRVEDFLAIYPQAQLSGDNYVLSTLDIIIVDQNQLDELETKYPSGTEITIGGNLYYRLTNIAIAEKGETEDYVMLKDIIYSLHLLNRGYEKLAEYGSTISFNGSIEPNTTFVYKEDYNLGDLVSVENEFGISAIARIVEVVEVNDENGYSVEPKFEYIS